MTGTPTNLSDTERDNFNGTVVVSSCLMGRCLSLMVSTVALMKTKPELRFS
ncbi:hypothetical protein M413DRAFT_437961, partial [Hebeloma cylindrosporum]